jgi:hypothetical protein
MQVIVSSAVATALSEILVTRVCGGSKIVKKKKIQKILDLLI